MPAKIVFDSVDEVPENLKDKAKEVDGKFEMDAKGVLDKNAQLLAKVAKHKPVQDELDALKGKIGDVDVDDLLESGTRIADLEKKLADATKDGNAPDEAAIREAVERAKQKWNKDQEEKIVKPLRTQVETLTGDVTKFKLDDKVKAAAISGGVTAKHVKAAIAGAKAEGYQFKLAEDDKIQILDAEGDVLNTTLDKFFGETFKEQMPIYYPPSGASGSGAPSNGNNGNNGAKPTMKRSEFDNLPHEVRTAKMKEGVALVD